MLTARSTCLPVPGQRAVFSGDSSLLIHCAQAWQKAGHTVVAVISADPQIGRWAATHDLLMVAQGAPPPLEAALEFDFLFSLEGHPPWPTAWVARAGTLALAFQASLLDAHAPPHAANWALIAQEESFAVGWLAMAPGESRPRRVKQLTFQLSEAETAWSLQAACYEKGLESFVSLIEEIGHGGPHLSVPVESGASFNPFQRPPALGTLDFSRPAIELASLVAGLNFGPHPNPVALAKIYLGTGCAVVQTARALKASSVAAPGLVLHAEGDTLRVSTSDGDLVLSGCSDAGGCAPDGLFRASMRLPAPPPPLLEQLDRRTPAIARGEQHWQAAYADLSPVELPYPRNSGAPGSGDRCLGRIKLPMKAPAALTVAAFLAWLAALTSQDRVSVLYCDQTLLEQTGDLGCWLSAWVPMSLSIPRDKPMRELAARVSAEMATTHAAGPCPHDFPLRMHGSPGGRIRLEKVGAGVIGQRPPDGMELMLALHPEDGSARLVADEAVYPHATLAVMGSHFSTFLSHFAAGDRLSAMALIPEDEAALMAEVNRSATPYDQATSVQDLVAAQARRTPHHAAIRFEGQALSYGALEARSDALARQLLLRGVKPEDKIGVCLPRGLEIVVSMLAILKAGAAYLPLDPAYPHERLAFMIEDSATPLVLTTETMAMTLTLPADKVFLSGLESDDSAPPATSVAGGAPAARTAYLMYTSGSTGKPKGVQVTQRGLLNLFAGLNATIPRSPPGRWLGVTSFSFDISVAELWWPLTQGFTVVIHSQSAAGWSVAQAMLQNEITHLFCTPSMLSVLMADDAGRQALSRMSVVMAGGEVFPLQLTTALCAVVPGKVFNVYGPTEITVLSNVCELSRHDTFVPLGPPIANTTLHVRTPDGWECPAWVTGELWIGGEGVSDGYWRRPELTAEKFIADPQRPGGRLYRTGDLVRRRPGGALEFVGRIDHQVKIRGHRIELGEIEKTIAALPGIKDAVVLATEHPSGDRRLVAYVVPQADATLETGDIQRRLAEALPALMVPATLLVLRSFPLTANGKIDRRALPSPALKPDRVDRALPQEGLERLVAAAWEQVLDIRDLKAGDHFFERGGSFFTAVQVQGRLREATGQLLPLADLTRFPTVRELARQLAGMSDDPLDQPRLNSNVISMYPRSVAAVPVSPEVTVAEAHTPVEWVLAGIWRELFDVEHIAKNDDFFELGGHSLAAVRMFAQLRQHYPLDLPLSALLEASSLAGFAALVERGVPAGHEAAASPSSAEPTHIGSLKKGRWSPLVTICRGDLQRQPLFCIHGSGGNVLNFKGLSQKLGPDRPVYGLQSQGVDGHLAMLESIEDMARQYVSAIRSVDPHGPYRLLGYSAGGVIAFEMAQQLNQAGAGVSLLAMIDTLTPAAAARQPDFLRKFWLMRHWSMKFARERYRNRLTRQPTDDVYPEISDKLLRGEWLPPELVERHLSRNIVRIQNQYQPLPYQGDILMFKARDATTQYLLAGDHLGWQAHMEGRIQLVSVTGAHLTVMADPGLTEMSTALIAELNRLDRAEVAAQTGAVHTGWRG